MREFCFVSYYIILIFEKSDGKTFSFKLPCNPRDFDAKYVRILANFILDNEVFYFPNNVTLKNLLEARMRLVAKNYIIY